jgi:hypothetical protein
VSTQSIKLSEATGSHISIQHGASDSNLAAHKINGYDNLIAVNIGTASIILSLEQWEQVNAMVHAVDTFGAVTA